MPAWAMGDMSTEKSVIGLTVPRSGRPRWTLVLEGYAAMHYSQSRFTKDLVLCVELTRVNPARIKLASQGSAMLAINVGAKDFGREKLH